MQFGIYEFDDLLIIKKMEFLQAYKVLLLSYFYNIFFGIPGNEFHFPGKSGISREENFKEIQETLIHVHVHFKLIH